jgi:putative ABC transport system permease protein
VSRARPGLLVVRAGRVPLGRRFLFGDRRRAALTVLGVAASLVLVLLLGGVLAGAVDRVTYYVRTSPASVIVSQSGVRTMHMSTSSLAGDTVVRAQQVPGVAWASPIGFASGSVSGPGGRQLAYLVGYDSTTGRGGPGRLVAGGAPGPGEAVLDEMAAEQLGIGLGQQLTVLGGSFRAVGLSTGGTSITNTTVFVDAADFARLRGPVVSYVLVGTDDETSPDVVADRLMSSLPDVTAQTRAEFVASEARVVTDMSADLLVLMSGTGLLVAMAVLGLGMMTSTLSQLRDFAVLKALGSTGRRLVGAVVVQVLLTVGLGTSVAVATAVALSWALPAAVPEVQVLITPSAVARTALLALVVGLAAALWPLRRVARVDAATAFREAS